MNTAHAAEGNKTAYDFSFTTLMGEMPMPLSLYKGKVLLVVNTASQCGYTPQYKGLQALFEAYKDKGLIIVGVPSNDFGGQEPGSAEEIKQFCELNYGVTFPMASKQVVTGAGAHPFYAWSSAALGASPKWNFHKILIDKSGKPISAFPSSVTPDSDVLKSAVDALL